MWGAASTHLPAFAVGKAAEQQVPAVTEGAGRNCCSSACICAASQLFNLVSAFLSLGVSSSLYQCKLANPASSLCLPVWISKGAERGGAPLEPFPSYLVPTILDNLLMPQIDKEELPCWES